MKKICKDGLVLVVGVNRERMKVQEDIFFYLSLPTNNNINVWYLVVSW